MNRLLVCLLLSASLPAMAQIYTYTDANGNTVFTNDPPGGVAVQAVSLPPTNTMADTPDDGTTAPPAPATPAPPSPAAAQPDSSASTSDDAGGGGDAYYNPQELADDVDRPRAAAVDAVTPGPARVDTPTLDAVVPGPGTIEEGDRR